MIDAMRMVMKWETRSLTRSPSGGQMDDEVRKYAGADAYGKDAVAAVNLCKGWIG